MAQTRRPRPRLRARGQAPAGIHTPPQYRETAEYGSRASLALARDDSSTIVLPPQRMSSSAEIDRQCVSIVTESRWLRSLALGPRLRGDERRKGSGRASHSAHSRPPPSRGQAPAGIQKQSLDGCSQLPAFLPSFRDSAHKRVYARLRRGMRRTRNPEATPARHLDSGFARLRSRPGMTEDRRGWPRQARA